jgi:hypothetical protein
MFRLIRSAFLRLLSSGLPLLAIPWCVLGRLSYYWLNHLLTNQWQQRIYDIRHLDLGTLRFLLVSVRQHALFPLLVSLFLIRLFLNPFIDAFVYCRLGRYQRIRGLAFGKLYLMLYLSILMLGWILYLTGDWLLALLMTHPFIFFFGGLVAISILSLWLILYKVRLAGETIAWPPPLVWLQVALARLLLFSTTLTASLWLHRRAMGTQSWPLTFLLFLAELLLIWGKLWQVSCAVQAAQDGTR